MEAAAVWRQCHCPSRDPIRPRHGPPPGRARRTLGRARTHSGCSGPADRERASAPRAPHLATPPGDPRRRLHSHLRRWPRNSGAPPCALAQGSAAARPSYPTTRRDRRGPRQVHADEDRVAGPGLSGQIGHRADIKHRLRAGPLPASHKARRLPPQSLGTCPSCHGVAKAKEIVTAPLRHASCQAIGRACDHPSSRVSCHCERSEAISIPSSTAMEIAASLRSSQ